jgi:hypothetical protein
MFQKTGDRLCTTSLGSDFLSSSFVLQTWDGAAILRGNMYLANTVSPIPAVAISIFLGFFKSQCMALPSRMGNDFGLSIFQDPRRAMSLVLQTLNGAAIQDGKRLAYPFSRTPEGSNVTRIKQNNHPPTPEGSNVFMLPTGSPRLNSI